MVLVAVVLKTAAAAPLTIVAVLKAPLKSYTMEVLEEVVQTARRESHNRKGSPFLPMAVNTAGVLDWEVNDIDPENLAFDYALWDEEPTLTDKAED